MDRGRNDARGLTYPSSGALRVLEKTADWRERPVNGAAHGQKRRLQNIQRVNFFNAGRANAMRQTSKFFKQRLALFFAQLFTVIDTEIKIGRQTYRRRRHRPGPGPAPRFIDPENAG